ncbi:hypothetical protein QE152_g9350 [Popillia japonica]|uniref:Uncharacterized protein n=1 Tax=Popillia japonica TaxID=7064 RepID=A0AAW1LZ73_POPJA
MLRPQDERKYAIYDKLKTLSDAKMKTKGPAITDLLEGLNKNEMVFHGANIPSTWSILSSEKLAERKHKSKMSSVKVKHKV